MKKIFILAYSKENLGDDLFIDILVNKYSNIDFYTRAIKENTYIQKKNANLHYKNYTIDDLINQQINQFDGIVYIGGSIFMEHAGGIERIEKLNTLALKCKEKGIQFFFISSNFGPYSSKEYKQKTEELLKNITDICFRDKKSYEQFKEITTVRYAPDVVLSYKEPYKKIKNTIGISVINFKFRQELKKYELKYYEVLKESILKYIQQGKTVILFSFCKYEGDEETIQSLLDSLPEEKRKSIEVQKYRGNIDEFIEKYSSLEYCICSRFHAMILSAICNQKVKILSYSQKINNVIEDLDITEKHLNIQELSQISEIKLEDFKEVTISTEIVNKAKEQFKAFEAF